MSKGQQQSQSTESALGPLWILVGIFAVVAIIWYVAQPQLVAFIFKIRLYEINVLSLFTTGLNTTAEQVRNFPPSLYGTVSFNDISTLSTRVGDYLRYPTAILIAILAVIIYTHNPVARYKKLYTMQRLIDEEKGDWPQIAPVAELDLVKEHVDQGAWAMALTPMQFAKKHQLLREERTIAVPGAVMQRRVIVSLLRGEAYRIFTLQLGPYWAGPLALPIYMQALFAIFAARVGGDRDGAFALVDKINRSTADGKLDFAGVRALLMKHKDQKQVVRVMQQHAFVYTAMASLLVLARGDGVLASADFLWLKPVDRALWFMLNAVGRQTPVAEVAGPYGHWIAESRFGHPIRMPVVNQAVNALDAAIQEVIYKPDEEDE